MGGDGGGFGGSRDRSTVFYFFHWRWWSSRWRIQDQDWESSAASSGATSLECQSINQLLSDQHINTPMLLPLIWADHIYWSTHIKHWGQDESSTLSPAANQRLRQVHVCKTEDLRWNIKRKHWHLTTVQPVSESNVMDESDQSVGSDDWLVALDWTERDQMRLLTWGMNCVCVWFCWFRTQRLRTDPSSLLCCSALYLLLFDRRLLTHYYCSVRCDCQTQIQGFSLLVSVMGEGSGLPGRQDSGWNDSYCFTNKHKQFELCLFFSSCSETVKQNQPNQFIYWSSCEQWNDQLIRNLVLGHLHTVQSVQTHTCSLR